MFFTQISFLSQFLFSDLVFRLTLVLWLNRAYVSTNFCGVDLSRVFVANGQPRNLSVASTRRCFFRLCAHFETMFQKRRRLRCWSHLLVVGGLYIRQMVLDHVGTRWTCDAGSWPLRGKGQGHVTNAGQKTRSDHVCVKPELWRWVKVRRWAWIIWWCFMMTRQSLSIIWHSAASLSFLAANGLYVVVYRWPWAEAFRGGPVLYWGGWLVPDEFVSNTGKFKFRVYTCR